MKNGNKHEKFSINLIEIMNNEKDNNEECKLLISDVIHRIFKDMSDLSINYHKEYEKELFKINGDLEIVNKFKDKSNAIEECITILNKYDHLYVQVVQ